MNEGSRNLLNAIRNDVLKAVLVTLAVAFATGLAGAVMSGAWQKGLLAACGLTVVVLVVILVAAAAWHSGELEEVNFEEMRSQDEAKRGVPSYERENREHVIRAAGRFRDEGDRHADCTAMVERGRRHMSKARPASVELLLLNDGGAGPPGPIAQAGRFDQAVVSTPNLLLDWLDSLGDQVYGCSVPVSGGRWRLLAIRDAAIDHHDRSEVQRLASWLVSLDLAHQIGADPLEESA
jgi:Na+-transporting methylmalonyl-CoA/oxaloacetate decarboxylase gamma subunit